MFDVPPDLVAAARAGRPEAVAGLWRRLVPLFRSVARRYRGVESEDALGEAALVYLEALRTWDPARGVPFTAYAARRLHFRLWTLARRWSREQDRRLSLPVPDPEGESGEPTELADARARNPFDEVEIRLLLAQLTPRERAALGEVLRGGTLAAFARREGITRQAAAVYFRRALRKLQKTWNA